MSSTLLIIYSIIINILLLGFPILGVVCNEETSGKLIINYYKDTCPRAEEIVKEITWKRVARNSSLPAKLLRMHFHDCFVRGCEGSILLNSTRNNTAEKDSVVNSALDGTYVVIDEIKAKLEKNCPGVVSCSDALALAARDSVSFQFGRSIWEVETGRRDGRVSNASEIFENLPAPNFNFTSLKQSFAKKGVSVLDLVVLSGGHTIGRGHCNTFSNRLYNFTGVGDADPTLDPTYADFLRTQCRNLTDRVTSVEMDPGSSLTFDTDYYRGVVRNKGLFVSDAALLTDSEAAELVARLRNPSLFFKLFGKSMQRMGAIDVLTGNKGEIRKKCFEVNKKNQEYHSDV